MALLKKTEQLEVHAEEMDEIIGQPPKGLIKWGTLIFLLIIGLISVVSYFIQYSDKVSSDLLLKASNAPKTVLAKTDGKLFKLFVKQNDFVKDGAIVGYIESQASYLEVIQLSNELNDIWNLIQSHSWEQIPQRMMVSYKSLGELQPTYQSFVSEFISLKNFLSRGAYPEKRAVLLEEANNLANLKASLLSQERVYTQDLLINKEDFEVKKKLHEQNLLTEVEFNQEKSKNLKIGIPLENIRSQILSNNTLIQSKRQELIQLDLEYANQRVKFLESLNTIISKVNEWKSKYLLISPIDGSVNFATYIQEKQDLKSGQEVLYILPQNYTFFGEMYIPQNNFGKIKLNQKTIISLDGFPFEEYGHLIGKTIFISSIAGKDNQYYVSIGMENGTKTDMNKFIEFKDGLKGKGEIITNRTRLINKFFFTIRNLIK